MVEQNRGAPWRLRCHGNRWRLCRFLAGWLAVQADADVVVYGSTGPLWSAGSVDSALLPGERLRAGWYLESSNRRCRLVMQSDSNLVLYSAGGFPLWATDAHPGAGGTAVMQGDGNFVVYSAAAEVLWASATEGHPGARLTLGDSAQLVIVSPERVELWSRG